MFELADRQTFGHNSVHVHAMASRANVYELCNQRGIIDCLISSVQSEYVNGRYVHTCRSFIVPAFGKKGIYVASVLYKYMEGSPISAVTKTTQYAQVDHLVAMILSATIYYFRLPESTG